jgi:hypothetical protein
MEISTYQIPSDEVSENSRRQALPATSSSIRFGSELLVYTDEIQKNAFDTGTVAPLQSRREDVSREQLHVVVQNGRLFQHHHPEVTVLHDRGRFLLVKLNPQEALKLKEESETCFGIIPVREEQVVFEESAAVAERAPVSFIQALVDNLNRERLEANLIMLTSFSTRNSTSAEYTSASARARKLLNQMNYQTRFQSITVNGGKSRNIIADKPGAGDEPRGVVIITAHLDSVNVDGKSAPAPGADDNGSGSAGLLEMARVFQNHRSRHDLRLILFGGEEQGLFGSKQYVAGLSASERKRIKAVVNMDMVGCLNSPAPTVLIEGAALSRQVIDNLKQAAATYTRLTVETSLNPFASDHVPFIAAGIPAVLTIEGADSTNTRVHSANDIIQTINYDFAMEILRMNIGYVAKEIGNMSS